jgi:hypothetical protein
MTNAYHTSVAKHAGKKQLGGRKVRWQDIIKTDAEKGGVE